MIRCGKFSEGIGGKTFSQASPIKDSSDRTHNFGKMIFRENWLSSEKWKILLPSNGVTDKITAGNRVDAQLFRARKHLRRLIKIFFAIQWFTTGRLIIFNRFLGKLDDARSLSENRLRIGHFNRSASSPQTNKTSSSPLSHDSCAKIYYFRFSRLSIETRVIFIVERTQQKPEPELVTSKELFYFPEPLNHRATASSSAKFNENAKMIRSR